MNKEIDLIRAGCTDAKMWAKEFNKVLSKRKVALSVNSDEVINEEFLTTWFANAIEVAKGSGPRVKQIEVWVYDDLWEEGYRFDNWNGTKHCFIPREYASCVSEAIEILDRIFEYIPKHQSDSVSGASRQISKELILVKEI